MKPANSEQPSNYYINAINREINLSAIYPMRQFILFGIHKYIYINNDTYIHLKIYLQTIFEYEKSNRFAYAARHDTSAIALNIFTHMHTFIHFPYACVFKYLMFYSFGFALNLR